MAKKRKSLATSLDEVDRTMYSTFCNAANSLSQLYSQAMSQQKLSFLSGERHGLEKLYQWISKQDAEGLRVTSEDILAYIEAELELSVDDPPMAPRTSQQNQQAINPFISSGSSSGPHNDQQSKNYIFSNALSSPVRRSLQNYHISQEADGVKNNDRHLHLHLQWPWLPKLPSSHQPSQTPFHHGSNPPSPPPTTSNPISKMASLSPSTMATAAVPTQATMVAPFTGLRSTASFPATKKAERDLSSLPSNGGRVQCMKVWPPLGLKKYETLSYLPPLTTEQLAKEVDYLLRSKWVPCLEFELEHGFVYRENHRSPGYYDGRYWTMWKLPMFGCTDSAQVINEVYECKKEYPQAWIRIIGFDNVRQVQCISFIASKPDGY